MSDVRNVNNLKAKAQVNVPMEDLIQLALSRNEGKLAANGALVVTTGARTGRSPKDRFIVRDTITESTVDWNNTNQPLAPHYFNQLWEKGLAYLAEKDTHFVSELHVGQHTTLGLPVTVMSELAWHQLFAHVLFIRSLPANHGEAWTILSVPGMQANGAEDGVNSDAAVILNFSERKIFICGTYYAGEMKKAMFSVLNFLLPEHDILPMHCAANAGPDGDTALFFGLSGTGKTTLSADPDRFLIGDDEHGWSQDGVFNFEGGCYAKCIDLSEEREPIIWNAIRHGAVIENVVIDPANNLPIYSDSSLTQNSRAAYPREFIPKRVESNDGQEPSAVIFLTCDLYGVLPPVAKLTTEQAAYYFLSGYTALVGSTEVGQGTGIKPTFSTCFGAPFFPRPPAVYAELLMKRLRHANIDVYLVNTGWTGGAQDAGGKRFSIPTTRAIVTAILNGAAHNAEYENLAGFNFAIPTSLPGVDRNLLNPSLSYSDKTAFAQNTQTLIQQFITNFNRFKVSDAVLAAGPQLLKD